MAKLSYHHKKNGVTYVYAIEKNYWDKDKKGPRNKQRCLGKLDPETGKIIPSKWRKKIVERAVSAPGVTATSRIAGPYLLLERITQEHGIDKLLKKCFHDKYEAMLSLVYFIVQKGIALSRSEAWSNACLNPFGKPIVSQRISELLREISEDERLHFLSLWSRHIIENDYLCYDITSVSSYSTKITNILILVITVIMSLLNRLTWLCYLDNKSLLPAYYRQMPGNISDVAKLNTTIQSLNFLGTSNMHFILDRGFYSAYNINELYLRRHKFTIALPLGRKWVEKVLDKHFDNIASPINYFGDKQR